MKLLSAGKDASLNVKGAYLEVWADMLGSIGVIVGAITIMLTGWQWVDPTGCDRYWPLGSPAHLDVA